MRHGNKINSLGRKKAHREAMLANMACSLIEHKRINTTVAKAKELRKYVEPLITKSKSDSTHSRRTVFSYLKSKEAVTELFREVAPKVADRPGGYVRILKTGRRMGDSAEMAMVELVDFNELMLETGKPTKAKRSRRGGKKKATTEETATAEATTTETTEETKAEAAPESTETEAKEVQTEAQEADKPEAAQTAETAEVETEATTEAEDTGSESDADQNEEKGEDEKKNE